MKPKHKKQDTTQRSSRYFCGLSRRAPSPNTTSFHAPDPPQNVVPISTTAAQQQRSNDGDKRPPADIAPLPSKQTTASQSPVGGQASQSAQPQAPRPQYNMFARPSKTIPLQAPTSHVPQSRGTLFARPLQTVPVQVPAPRVLPSPTPSSQGSPSHTLPLRVNSPIVLPSLPMEPLLCDPSPTEPRLPSTPKLSPRFFSKFTSLPREIRDLIWLQKLRDLSLPLSLPVNQIRKSLPAFCHVNRQIFCETVPLFLQSRSIELGSKEHAKRLFQFLNHVPDGEAYRGVRSLAFENCWSWTSVSAIPFLREVLAKCNCVRHITLEVTQKFIYEPLYYNPPGAWSPPPNRSEYRKLYIKTYLFHDLDRLFLHDTTNLRTVKLRGSGKHDALQLSYPPRDMKAGEWLDYLEWSGLIDDPKPPDALLNIEFAEWKSFMKSKGEGCSQWMEDLMSRVPLTTYDATNFTGSYSYISSSPSLPVSAPVADTSSAFIPLLFASTSPRPGPIIYESSDYYSASGFESGSYEGFGYELPHSADRPSGFWSSGALSPGHRSSALRNRRTDFDYLGPGL